MPLPTTNLVANIDFSTGSSVFEAFANPMTNTAEDADNVEGVNDLAVANQILTYITSAANGPTYRTTSQHPSSLGVGEFNGSSEFLVWFNDAGSVSKVLASFVNSTTPYDYTLLISFKLLDGSAADDAASFDLPQLIGDMGGYWGVGVRESAGVHSVEGWVYDTATRSINQVVSLNTWYVLRVRKTGGNLRLSIDGGSETSTAAGAIGDRGFIMRLCSGYGGTLTAGACIGEVAIYNTGAPGGTDLADATSYFTAKWLAAAGGNRRRRLLLAA